jgi:L-threonylcarbamoyladenylate synthase
VLIIRTDQETFEPDDVGRCAEVLAAGGIGIIPTDTVYGIAALVRNAEAVCRVGRIKDRPPDKPLPVQVASAREANLLALADSPAAAALIERFWPGGLTIVMERRPGFDLPFQDPLTIGLRIPASRFCLELIARSGCLVVPSANRSGMPPPARPEEISAQVLESVDFVVEAGACPGGIESSVVDITTGVRVIREGAISCSEIMRVTGGAP